MMKVEVLIQSSVLDAVKAALETVSCDDIVVTEVFLTGRKNTVLSHYRGCEYQADVSRVRLEMLVSTNCVDEAVSAILCKRPRSWIG